MTVLGVAAGLRQAGSQRRYGAWERWAGGVEEPAFTLSKTHFSWVYSANLLMKESSFSGMMTL